MTRIGVVVASLGRAEEVAQLLARLAVQTLPPAMVVLSVESPADLPAPLPESCTVVMGPRSLTAQRNRGLELVLPACELLVFFDDDFIPCKTALAEIAALFAAEPGIVAATGTVLRDGVKSGGLPHGAALMAVNAHEAASPPPLSITDTDEVYGCNMAFRCGGIGRRRFDEALPLYGWQEDVDFAGQLLAGGGRVVRTNAFAGVHRGVSKGRSSGVALGFSQIVNPAYLARKGTMRRRKAASLTIKNLLANHARALAPEPFIDRRGRVRGNWHGILHLLRGRLDPRAIPMPRRTAGAGAGPARP